MVPAAFQVLDAMPLTPSGKVDRAALPEPQRAGAEDGGAFIPPKTEAERVLARLWEQILRVDRVGARDNFLQLGGDSILSIQIVAQIGRAHVRTPVPLES